MGKNYRFRISDMMPNTWFYKLKDMGRRGSKNQYSAGRSQHQTPRSPTTSAATPKLLPGRGSFYYSSRAEEAAAAAAAAKRFAFSPTHHLRRASDALYQAEPPRKSKKSNRRKPGAGGAPAKPRSLAPSLSAACRESVVEFPPPETPPCRRDYYVEYEHLASWSHSCNCRAASSAADILIDVSRSTSSAPKPEKLDAAELNLPPILTKPTAKEPEFEDKGVVGKSQAKRSSAGLRRLRTRANSPRTPGKKAQARRGRRSTSSSEGKGGVAASFAVVKASSDPQRDFRESMMEMIRENDIRAAKDLEELLACYLSLNANEYHDVIVKVFEQIWFDLNFSCAKLVDC